LILYKFYHILILLEIHEKKLMIKLMISHMLIIFKDLNNNVYFIDKQIDELYKYFKIYENYLKILVFIF